MFSFLKEKATEVDGIKGGEATEELLGSSRHANPKRSWGSRPTFIFFSFFFPGRDWGNGGVNFFFPLFSYKN